jgi:predicted metal-dependent hydrolase
MTAPSQFSLPLEAPPEAPGAGKPAGNLRRLQLRQAQLEYTLRRSKRKTIGFLINEHGLRVTAPRWITLRDIEQAIRGKEAWILSKLTLRRERIAQAQVEQMRWQDGAQLPYLGGMLALRIHAAARAALRHDEAAGELALHLPAGAGEEKMKALVKAWLQEKARQLFAARLPLYAQKLGVSYRAFALTSAKTQWGSCTSAGMIRLHWRLMHFAPEHIDYVIAHELAHLIEMNHSPRFWAVVASVFPQHAASRKVLREHGLASLPAL